MREYQNHSNEPTNVKPSLLRLQEVAEIVAMGTSTILSWEKSGKFPKALRLSPGKRVWLASDIDHWIKQFSMDRFGSPAAEKKQESKTEASSI